MGDTTDFRYRNQYPNPLIYESSYTKKVRVQVFAPKTMANNHNVALMQVV
jgi:hypothetical protein